MRKYFFHRKKKFHVKLSILRLLPHAAESSVVIHFTCLQLSSLAPTTDILLVRSSHQHSLQPEANTLALAFSAHFKNNLG